MLDIQFIRQNEAQVRAAISNKRLELDLDALLGADRERRDCTTALEQKRARRNELSALIPKASKDDRPKLVDEAKQIRTEIEQLEPKLADAQRRYQDLMLRVPSLPRPEVPVGKGEEDNVEIRRVGIVRAFDFTPKDHVDLDDVARHGRVRGAAALRRRAILRPRRRRRAARDGRAATRGRHPHRARA